MNVKTYTEKGDVWVTVMHVDGNIDSSTYEAFQSKADELIDNGAHFVLVDLSHVKFVSSAGMRALQYIHDRLRSLHLVSDLSDEDVKKGILGGTYKSPFLKLLSPSTETATTFNITGFDLFIEMFTDKDEAIASF